MADLACAVVLLLDLQGTIISQPDLTGAETLAYIDTDRLTAQALGRSIRHLYIPAQLGLNLLNFSETLVITLPVCPGQIL